MTALQVRGSREEFALFNPAFTAEVLLEAARGCSEESGRAGSAPVVFCSATMAIYSDLRSVLPTTTRTYLTRFLHDNPGFLPDFHRLMRGVAPPLWTGLTYAIANDTLRMEGLDIVAVPSRRRRPGAVTSETAQILSKSRWCGRWLTRSGTPATVLSVLGFSR